ncbi:MAG: SDR family NAD(P)-dependent oxidoreductase [Kiritimatiellae bacterium]|nr:SDR family NAD(P)-dependent oxidoreductase [Kiritimatiellia bacterium]
MNAQKNLYLVTGASGFVGGHLVDYLLQQGISVRAMVRDEKKARKLKEKGAEVVVANMADATSLAAAVDVVQGVYHIAALFRQAGFPEHVFHDVNAEGTRRLLDASIAAGVERFVYCSTSGVMGHVKNPPANEETPYSPGDMYQRSKMEGEKIALEYFRSNKISGVAIRPAMVYGPGDTRILKLFRMIARRMFFFVGRGEATVHWVDVRDLVRSFMLAMEKEEYNGEIYIIAGESCTTLKKMVDLIATELNVSPPKIHLPVKPMQWLGSTCETICTPLRIQPPLFRRRVDFYTKSRAFDTSKAKQDLDFAPAQTFGQEIKDIIKDYKEHGYL